MKILITGIPGTGKTTIGNYLALAKGYEHLDIEEALKGHDTTGSEIIQNFIDSPSENKVITWGFIPEIDDNGVKKFLDLGYKMIWFDGNRNAARKAFLKRGDVPVEALDNQMVKIEKYNLEKFKPIHINTFSNDGVFLEKEIIIETIWEYTSDEENSLKFKIQEFLGKEITQFALKGKGAVSNAYYIETTDGKKYVVKQERIDKEFQPQNDLVVEAKVAQQLHGLNLSIPIPNVIFISENPKMYGYEYVEGDLMRGIWDSLSENEKIDICRKLGHFHAEIGKKFTKEMAKVIGIKIDMSADLHSEVSTDYNRLVLDMNVPENLKILAKEAKLIFNRTRDNLVFQFLHNDSHHENIIIKDKMIAGIIDFGNAEYGEIAKEFSRYIRDYPEYFQHIISTYEEASGNKLSYKRLVSNALISGFIDIAEDYSKGGENRKRAEKAIATYRKLLS